MNGLCRDCLAWFVTAPRRCPACASPRIVAHPELAVLAIAHLDCDAFYASVEKRDRPELRDAPVIVGGARRGVVAAACYVARTKGVRSAMPMFEARRLCPEATIIPPDFRKYKAASKAIFDKVRALTPLVQSLALDEAWFDLSGTERLHGSPPALTLARLQAEVERDVGVTVSVGLATNRFLAKIASEADKPRGFAVIGAGDATLFLDPKPVSVLPGVGAVAARAFEAAGFRTVGNLARAEPRALARRFGPHAVRLAALARGEDRRDVDPDPIRKSISAETTFAVDLTDLDDLEGRLGPLCDRVAHQARVSGLAGRVVTLKLRHADYRIITRRRTLESPTQTARTLFAQSRVMLRDEAHGQAWRLIGVGLADLMGDGEQPASLFADPESKARQSETAVDALRGRFGAQAIVNARDLRDRSRDETPK